MTPINEEDDTDARIAVALVTGCDVTIRTTTCRSQNPGHARDRDLRNQTLSDE
jgi:hypothetical protein